jgi:NTP pyrophosphatase (non-canonical NTP hydrolase)
MNLSEYEQFVVGLMSEDSMVDLKSRMHTAGHGLTGESGEFADHIKKICFHKAPFDAARRQNMIKELGDIMFYVAFAAVEVLGISIQEAIDVNVAKLSDRYKTGKFTAAEFLAKEAAKNE